MTGTELPDSNIFGTENEDTFMKKAKIGFSCSTGIGNRFIYNRVTLAISAVCRIRRVLSFEICLKCQCAFAHTRKSRPLINNSPALVVFSLLSFYMDKRSVFDEKCSRQRRSYVILKVCSVSFGHSRVLV